MTPSVNELQNVNNVQSLNNNYLRQILNLYNLCNNNNNNNKSIHQKEILTYY